MPLRTICPAVWPCSASWTGSGGSRWSATSHGVRAATRIESALLPGISYETFDAGEREQALAWVEGRRAFPHGPAVKIIETDRPDVLGFEVDGKISAEEMAAVADYFSQAARRDSPRRLLGRFKRIRGAEFPTYFNRDYYRMKFAILERLERYALVGGPAWLAPWARMLDPLFKAEIRHFAAEDEAQAWSWLGASPAGERALAA